MNKKLLLIDGNSLTYRAFYGTANSSRGILTNSQGTPINAVLTLNLMLNKAFAKYKPTHVLVAFDAGKRTIRHDKLESYKGGRKKTPIELIKQFPIVKEMLDNWKIQRYEINQIEADDIIGTLAIKLKDEINIAIMSSDKDLYQLIQPNVNIIIPQNGIKEDRFINDDNFIELMGYRPDQVIDMKGLTGDSSDNLPGVHGIGEKGAIKLLDKFNTLEGVYENLEAHTPNLQKKLLESKKVAFMCKELATLMTDLEIPLKLKDLEFKNDISEEFIDFFKRYELMSLVRKFSSFEKIKKTKENKQISFDNILF